MRGRERHTQRQRQTDKQTETDRDTESDRDRQTKPRRRRREKKEKQKNKKQYKRNHLNQLLATTKYLEEATVTQNTTKPQMTKQHHPHHVPHHRNTCGTHVGVTLPRNVHLSYVTHL